jgi:hypothetical protein
MSTLIGNSAKPRFQSFPEAIGIIVGGNQSWMSFNVAITASHDLQEHDGCPRLWTRRQQ